MKFPNFSTENQPQNKGAKATEFCFTYQDIADATQLDVRAVKRKYYEKQFNPYNLLSLSQFIIGVLSQKGAKNGN